MPFGPLQTRDEAIETVHKLLEDNSKVAAHDRMLIYRMAYLPQEGMFKLMPTNLDLGTYIHEQTVSDGISDESGETFVWEGQKYCVGSFVYLNPRYCHDPWLPSTSCFAMEYVVFKFHGVSQGASPTPEA